MPVKKMSVKNKIQLVLLLMGVSVFMLPPEALAGNRGCTAKECHAGIMDIVPADLPMMTLIRQNGMRHGDMDGCVVCHGGNPGVRRKEKAHKGIPASLKTAPGPKGFYPDPGNVWIAQNTCGACHAGYVYRTKRSLMNTEAGKIRGNLTTWGIKPDPGTALGNHDVDDDDGPVPLGTTPAYETYMADMKQNHPGQFPGRLNRLPAPSVQDVETDPKLAAYTYLRQECQRCHIGVKGRNIRGDHRGTGCSACHMPYGNEGLYQGRDKSISKTEPGHILRHRIAGNRKTGGIPVETCNTCHNRGKRIGVSFSGLMESPFSGPFNLSGEPQPLLHGKTYTQVSEDLHHRYQSREGNPEGGLLCQDCHTSMDIHGDGNIQGTTLAQVEIECSDCHGTPDQYPWELPLGHGDEFGRPAGKEPRGTAANRLMSGQQFGFDYPPSDGYILSARGNPLGNVVRKGNRVMVHSATGRDYFVPVLKNQGSPWKTPAAAVAMAKVSRHMDRMECYACHGAWAPQCYGCHVKVDYSKGPRTDWVAVSNQLKSGHESGKASPVQDVGITTPGRITEQNGYMRWEDPVLGINGEGRISPLIPGCQVVYSVIGKGGKTIVHNRAPENPAEGKSIGQDHIPLALDMAPVQPHTASPAARSCESCHTRPKTLGLGINQGLFKTVRENDRVIDIRDSVSGAPLPSAARVQFPGIENLTFDWSKIVDKDGIQVATVGTHWPLSRAFNKEELGRITRTGLCIGCHQHQGTPDIWKKISTDPALDTRGHTRLMEKMLKQFSQKNQL
ncbi:MAG: hypothetical protein MI863_17090 [Desulfobacterales bacterium]|nr:hypothetical protein [Desulfobacterales bacterium]